MTTLAPPGWRRVPTEQVVAELTRLNYGRAPTSIQDCRRIAALLHWKIYLDNPWPDAYADEDTHVIGIPPCADERTALYMTLHELSEIVTHRAGGEPEYHFVGGEEEHHQVARLVEAWQAAIQEELERLREEVKQEEAIVQAIRARVDALGAVYQAYCQEIARGTPITRLKPPDHAALSVAVEELGLHTVCLQSLRARLERW